MSASPFHTSCVSEDHVGLFQAYRLFCADMSVSVGVWLPEFLQRPAFLGTPCPMTMKPGPRAKSGAAAGAQHSGSWIWADGTGQSFPGMKDSPSNLSWTLQPVMDRSFGAVSPTAWWKQVGFQQ
ncbi:hypothetical protein VULLAG_LOCUS9048 [Vulpes lagopus]